MASTHKEEIVNGPSKWTLTLALFDWKPHRKVTVETKSGLKFELWITGVSAEDGSGESWNLSGTTQIQAGERKTVERSFTSYFRTDNRTGWILVHLR